MKKNKQIKILKNKTTIGNYTFIDDGEDTLPSNPVSDEIKEHVKEQSLLKQMDEKYKKKKVMDKDVIHNNPSKGLKFANQSQRNHSSVYE
jgi:hypothetical protein